LIPPVAAATLAHQLINELDGLGDRFVLVLDDYDRINDHDVHEIVAMFVRRPPRAVHLVIATRHDPPLPLAKLRADGRLAEVRMGDLRLRPEEIAAFWQGKSEQPFDAESIGTLNRVLEGWAAGLRLAAITVRLAPDPQKTVASLAAGNTHTTDYLFREIFAGLPPARQQWLLRIAQLDRFCAPLCEALSEPERTAAFEAGADFIDWMKSMNLFLVSLDDEGTWYRFHHLFLQLLRQQQAKRLDAATVAGLRLRASAWLAGAGQVDEALQYALAAGAIDQALAVVEQGRVTLTNREDWPRIQRWLDMFPAHVFDQAPSLWKLKAWLLSNQFRLAEIGPLIQRLEHDAEFAPELAYMRAQAYFWRTDIAPCLHWARLAAQTIPRETTLAYGSTILILALALQVSGQYEEGLSMLLRELNNSGPGHPALAARLLIPLVALHWAAGNLDYVHQFGQRLAALGEEHHLPASRGWAHFYLGCAHYWRNEMEQAAGHFGAVVEHPFGVHRLAVLHSHFGLALTHLACQQAALADATIRAAQASAVGSGDLLLVKQADAFAASCALAKGERAVAFAWRERQSGPSPLLPSYFLTEPLLILARVCLAQGGDGPLAEAAALVAQVRCFLEKTHNSLRMLDVLALEALLHQARGERAAALDVLRTALTLAEPQRIVRPFIDLGADMAALLHEAAKGGAAADYAGRVLAAYPHGGVQVTAWGQINQAPTVRSVEPLTDRELEVIALLAQRLSNKEIATILVVSPVTVKSHMRNLFAKLQVNGRREAVARARELGLLR
jgi:LuxR family maltose regulon positive regulatory protein